MKLSTLAISVGTLLATAISGNAQALYVGANYPPHDNKSPEKIEQDIALMKVAGFKVVRIGHLAWASYEPVDGSRHCPQLAMRGSRP